MKEKIQLAKQALLALEVYSSDANSPERCGFIDQNDILVEVANMSPKPEEGYIISPKDVLYNTEEVLSWATWHTHPGTSSNLSGEDYRNFRTWPDLVHFIVGKDGVRCYQFDREKKSVIEL